MYPWYNSVQKENSNTFDVFKRLGQGFDGFNMHQSHLHSGVCYYVFPNIDRVFEEEHHHQSGNPDCRATPAPRRAGQTRCLRGNQGCHQVHQLPPSKSLASNKINQRPFSGPKHLFTPTSKHTCFRVFFFIFTSHFYRRVILDK